MSCVASLLNGIIFVFNFYGQTGWFFSDNFQVTCKFISFVSLRPIKLQFKWMMIDLYNMEVTLVLLVKCDLVGPLLFNLK